MNGSIGIQGAQVLSVSRKARVLSLAARRPTKTASPNRKRLVVRATVWSLGLLGAAVFIPMAIIH